MRRNRDTANGFIVGWVGSGALIWALDIQMTLLYVVIGVAIAATLVFMFNREQESSA